MSDEWADPHKAGGTVQSKEAERSELAKKMEEFIAKNGPVETAPISSPDESEKRISKVIRKKTGITAGCNLKSPKVRAVLSIIRQGTTSPTEIAQRASMSPENISYYLKKLVDGGHIKRVEIGHYEVVE